MALQTDNMKVDRARKIKRAKIETGLDQGQFIFVAPRVVIVIELHSTFHQDVVLSGTYHISR
jgi:hypothetical protein